MLNRARTLGDILKTGDMCPYCRSTNVEAQTGESARLDHKCPDCGFQWDADGIDVPKDEPLPPQV